MNTALYRTVMVKWVDHWTTGPNKDPPPPQPGGQTSAESASCRDESIDARPGIVEQLLSDEAEASGIFKLESRSDAPEESVEWYQQNGYLDDDACKELSSPREFPVPCPWCGGRSLHNPDCIDLCDDWNELPFGKHKGENVRFLETPYLIWLLSDSGLLSSAIRQAATETLLGRRDAAVCKDQCNTAESTRIDDALAISTGRFKC